MQPVARTMPKVLIIDDNQKVTDLIAKFLNRKGLDAEVAPDGVSAIRSFVAEWHDLLLVNRELPAMHGDVFCRKIRETPKGRDIPIIMMSGYLKEQTDIDVLKQNLRLSGFLVKPFTSEALLVMISSAIRGSSTAPAPQPLRLSGAAGPAAVKGSLDRIPFEQILLILMKKKATGTLFLNRDTLHRTYVLIDGAIADLLIAEEDSDFGDYLAGKKLIEPAELGEYNERRKQNGSDQRELFVKMGCLTPLQFREESRNFLQERLAEGFSWKSGSVLFEPSPSVLKSFPPAAVLMPALFFRGFHAEACADSIRAFMNEQGKRFPVRTAEFYEYQNHLADEAAAAEVLELCDGSRTCSEILASADAEEAAILLYTLHYLKALTFSETRGEALPPPFPLRERVVRQAAKNVEMFEDLRGELSELADEVGSFDAAASVPPAPAQAGGLAELEEDLKKRWQEIKDKNYYEMFGMKQNSFSFDRLKKAYFELTKTYGPEKFFASSSEIMSLAEEMLTKVSNAYETLGNVVSKESYDELMAVQEQVPEGADDRKFYEQIQFQSGKVFVDQGQYESAEKAFTNCVNMDPDKAEYLAYLALAIYHNPANKGSAAAVRRAKDTVNKSLQLGKLSMAYALKGTIYLDEGGLNFAEAEFNKALRLNPNNKTALKKLEFIKSKREEDKKGIFQRIFK
jgi:DNA-binding response OmpR family regulator/tetratricopeptide (TPR) repeat protein